MNDSAFWKTALTGMPWLIIPIVAFVLWRIARKRWKTIHTVFSGILNVVAATMAFLIVIVSAAILISFISFAVGMVVCGGPCGQLRW